MYKVGDKVRAMVWRRVREEAQVVEADILEADEDPKMPQCLLAIPGWPTWWVTERKAQASDFAGGYILGLMDPQVRQKSKSVSPFMHDPYGVGPEGTTGGPSGLQFL